jgi:hypothetical protein
MIFFFNVLVAEVRYFVRKISGREKYFLGEAGPEPGSGTVRRPYAVRCGLWQKWRKMQA